MEIEDGVELEDIEVRLLLEAVYAHYGYDFREYAYPYLKRRILHAMKLEEATTVSALQDRLLHDSEVMDRLLALVSVKVTAIFRDPSFYVAFRSKVLPILRTYPFFRIWHAGCATGEEVYSMAILLEEEGLYDRCRIYATDISKDTLERATSGIFPLGAMQEYSANYLRAGGRGSLSDYFTARYGNAIFRASLRRNVLFARHNLAMDSSFNAFHVILCRNVLIYFDEVLRNRVHGLLYDSLVPFGILGLGSAEMVRFTPFETCYQELDPVERLYRKLPRESLPSPSAT